MDGGPNVQKWVRGARGGLRRPRNQVLREGHAPRPGRQPGAFDQKAAMFSETSANRTARRRRPATLATVLGSAALTLLLAIPSPASADVACDKVAAAGGSDSAAGTAAQPFATPQRLADSLAPGQTGCVRGTLTGNLWIGRDAVTIASEPGQRGKVVGQVKVQPGADGVTVRDLDLDGHRPGGGSVLGPAIYGDDATFANNDVTNGNTAICFIIGTYGHDGNMKVARTRIEGNRIHNCGPLPRTNMGHAIYVEHTQDARIVGNEIYDNADRGVQLYPNSQGTLVAGNVIDGNGVGVIFSGTGGAAASNNVVRHNVITNPTARAAVESWYPDGNPKGTGNVVEQNCVFGVANPISTTFGGFTHSDNLVADPQFVDRGAKDFRLREGSPCAAVLAAGRSGLAALPPLTKSATDAGTAATTTTAPAPVVPAGTTAAPTTSPTKSRPGAQKRPGARLALRHRRYGRALALNVRLVDETEGSVRALVEVRYGKRGLWRPVAVPRLQSARSFNTVVGMPRKARRIMVRASVIDASDTFVARLSLKNPRPATEL